MAVYHTRGRRVHCDEEFHHFHRPVLRCREVQRREAVHLHHHHAFGVRRVEELDHVQVGVEAGRVVQRHAALGVSEGDGRRVRVVHSLHDVQPRVLPGVRVCMCVCIVKGEIGRG